MYKLSFFFLLILILFTSNCGSNKSQTNPANSVSPTPLNQTNNPTILQPSQPKTLLEEAKERDPQDKILVQAQIIRDRLRYFGEELKTTQKPEKQKALMEDVRASIKSACKEIETIIPTTIFYSDTNVNNFLTLCYKLDKTLATHNPKALPDVLKDFNSIFDNLQITLTSNPKK
ncbi:MAG: hypothetical protein FD167_1996 [bacterium]|nr:MAG: hypothetical protein FD167_1996 [bacterium]